MIFIHLTKALLGCTNLSLLIYPKYHLPTVGEQIIFTLSMMIVGYMHVQKVVLVKRLCESAWTVLCKYRKT